MTIRQLLDTAKRERGLAMRTIALHAGLSPSTVTRLARGNTGDPMSSTHKAIADAIHALTATLPPPTPASGTRKAARGTPKHTTRHTATATKRDGQAGVGNQ